MERVKNISSSKFLSKKINFFYALLIVTILGAGIVFLIMPKINQSYPEISAIQTTTLNGPITQFAGEYDWPGNKDLGEITIYPEPATKEGQPNKVLFYLEVSRGAPDYNSGALYDYAYESAPGKFSYYDKIDDQDICALTLSFEKNNLTVTSVNGDDGEGCDFGYGVSSDGVYTKVAGLAPQYFIDRTGTKVYFKDTPPGSYLE